MKTDTIFTDCLSFEQLRAYSSNTTNKQEHEQLYMHISSCELCASAVNGFAAMPFSFDDLKSIHHKIDVKTNASHARSITFTHVSIVIISLVSIFGFYKWVDLFSKDKINPILVENVQIIEPAASKAGSQILVVKNNEHSIKKATKKTMHQKRIIFQNENIPIKEIESIPVNYIETTFKKDEDALKTNYNSDVIYIYDLKVADYNKLYFNHVPQTAFSKGYTPPSKENEKSSNNWVEKEGPHSIAANRVLKQGLECFNKGKYTKAISSFQLLLENNPDDINALFYGGLSLSQMGKNNSAINYLEHVLKSSNNVFYQEAKWNLALLKLKTSEQETAKQLLIEIVNEKGFYSQKAQEKLNEF